jgi:hypothetical protein
VSGRFILFIGVCLAACLTAVHLHKSISVRAPLSQTAATLPLKPEPSPDVRFPTENADNKNSDSVASPGPEITTAQVQTNAEEDLKTKLETRQELMARLRDWAAKDLNGALTYVSQMPEGDERNDALQAVCFGLAQKDPAHAVEVAQALQQPEAVMEDIVQQWATTDLRSALVWVNNQPAGDQRDQLIARTTFILSQTDPSDAASLVMEEISPGSTQDEAIMTVVNQWANKDLKTAASWVQTFPDSPLRERALSELEGVADYRQALARQ